MIQRKRTVIESTALYFHHDKLKELFEKIIKIRYNLVTKLENLMNNPHVGNEERLALTLATLGVDRIARPYFVKQLCHIGKNFLKITRAVNCQKHNLSSRRHTKILSHQNIAIINFLI